MKIRKDETRIAIHESKEELLRELTRAWDIIDTQAQRIKQLEAVQLQQVVTEANASEARDL